MFLQCSTEALSVQQHRLRALPELSGSDARGQQQMGKRGLAAAVGCAKTASFFSAGSMAVFAVSHWLASLFGQESLCKRLCFFRGISLYLLALIPVKEAGKGM